MPSVSLVTLPLPTRCPNGIIGVLATFPQRYKSAYFFVVQRPCQCLITLLIRKFILISLGSSAITYFYFCLFSPECSILSLFFKAALMRRGKGKRGEKNGPFDGSLDVSMKGQILRRWKEKRGRRNWEPPCSVPERARHSPRMMLWGKFQYYYFSAFFKTEVNCPSGREISFAIC